MKKIDFRQRAAKTEERKRKSKYADVMVRATVMGLMKPDEDVGQKRMGASAQSTAGNRNSNKGHHQRVHEGAERVPV